MTTIVDRRSRRSLWKFLILLLVGIYVSLNLVLHSALHHRQDASTLDHSPLVVSRETNLRWSRIPFQCRDQANQFDFIQSTSPQHHPVVFCCHRTWCQSLWGHCDACAGVGDRTLNLLPKVHYALQHNVSIQLDYPLTNVVELPPSTVYKDVKNTPAWLADVLHYRSYDVSHRTTRAQDWGLEPSFAHFFATDTDRSFSSTVFDPCWFHILFQPTASLQRELLFHEKQLKLHSRNANNKIIGIHFRTGDAVAFANKTQLHADVRTHGLQADFERMLECARRLAEGLYPREDTSANNNNNNNNNNKNSTITYFLASDHEQVKQLARAQGLYTTDCVPSSYLHVTGEYCTWLDLFLLSSSSVVQGLVMNVVPSSYNGPAGRMSTLAKLVTKVNFHLHNASHRYECHL